SDSPGVIRTASGGTLFLDEIGDLPLDVQPKLLRFLESSEVHPIGEAQPVRVDVRIIAATNADLEAAVQQGIFREDLFYRLNVITINLPPLRHRSEDVPLLAQHFLQHYARENEKPLREISSQAMELLLDHHWPGNVRELENAVERAVVLSTGEVLDVDLLPASVRAPESHGTILPATLPSNGLSFKDAVSQYERQIIVRALQAAGGVQKRAAELLQVKPTTLHEMMKRLNISSESVVSS
ncbi:MAG: sigma 54-interacting transcriptional regulator, partial [Thermoanaerobaculia bacterium]